MNITGSYVLVLRSAGIFQQQIGRLGQFSGQKGYYLYVGSAFGPGGVKARVSRHADKTRPVRWHIDYLKPHIELVEIWYSHDPRHREHQWVKLIHKLSDEMPMKGFGSSDCNCYSHLFYFSNKPTLVEFERMVLGKYRLHQNISVLQAVDL